MQFKGVSNLIVLARDVDILGLKVRVRTMGMPCPYSFTPFLTFPPVPLQDIFLQLSVADAQATVESDRLRIINDIKMSTGIEVG